MHWNAAESVELDPGHSPRDARVDFQDQNLSLAIEKRFGGKENVGAEDTVDFIALGGTAKTAEIDEDHGFVDKIQRAQPEIARDRDGIECTVDAEPGRDLRFTGNRFETEMLPPVKRDCTDGRAGIDAEQRRFAVDLSMNEQMVLTRTRQGQRF